MKTGYQIAKRNIPSQVSVLGPRTEQDCRGRCYLPQTSFQISSPLRSLRPSRSKSRARASIGDSLPSNPGTSDLILGNPTKNARKRLSSLESKDVFWNQRTHFYSGVKKKRTKTNPFQPPTNLGALVSWWSIQSVKPSQAQSSPVKPSQAQSSSVKLSQARSSSVKLGQAQSSSVKV